MLIAGHEIGREPFTIAEVGLNHNGDLDRARAMIGVAAALGVTAVKFQTFKAADVCDEEQEYAYQSQGKTVTEKRINIFRRAELPASAWAVLKAECERNNVVFLSTPETPADLALLMKVGIPAIKIGSDNLTNLPMLRYCAQSGLPIILSCGMSDMKELHAALHIVSNAVVMVCTSQYPCPPDEANLARVETLLKYCAEYVGFSDHTSDHMSAAIAVALGASVFEKHFTLSHDLRGPDHWWSANPRELAEWVHTINTAWTMLGDGKIEPSEREREAKAKYQRRVAA